jgi:hypothetical protein
MKNDPGFKRLILADLLTTDSKKLGMKGDWIKGYKDSFKMVRNELRNES